MYFSKVLILDFVDFRNQLINEVDGRRKKTLSSLLPSKKIYNRLLQKKVRKITNESLPFHPKTPNVLSESLRNVLYGVAETG